jgi:hypothetical protein
MRSNRTIVGLKQVITAPDAGHLLGSNRTIVGLKLVIGDNWVERIAAAIAPLWD